MKRSILCLLVLLTLCVCTLFVSCKQEDPAYDAPDAADVGQKGESQTQKVDPQPDYLSPDNAETNQQIPGFTVR